MQEPAWAATRAPTVSAANLLPVQKLWGKSWAWLSPRLSVCMCVCVEGWLGGFGESRGSPGRWKHNFISFQVVGLFQFTYFSNLLLS